MIWTVAELLAIITETIALQPGDIVATGTPAGIGARRTPPLFLVDGDVVEVEIEAVGTIRNTMTSS
jgi:2-keto-4-pentenoate hydratase/2-oxohepta-3-ene-1,7-dioic acid hydratase in catechol pathway